MTAQPLNRLSAALLALLLTAACTAAGDRGDTGESSLTRGEYLVNLLGCGRCHTEGYLQGDRPSGPPLAGSRLGIAYSDSDDGYPGLIFPSNLTPDPDTGLGGWSRRDIVRVLTTGIGRDGHQRLPVMPWPNYGALSDEDLDAIAGYLMSLEPVRREIPAMTRPGDPPQHRYVRFGIYVFEPFEAAEPSSNR